MKRIEEFVKYGKQYVYFDLSGIKTNDELKQVIEQAKTVMEKYKKPIVRTITNIEGMRFDTESKNIIAEWMKFNYPFVKSGVIIGMDGIKKIMLNSLLAISGRSNIIGNASTKEQAVEMLKQREWDKVERWAHVASSSIKK